MQAALHFPLDIHFIASTRSREHQFLGARCIFCDAARSLLLWHRRAIAMAERRHVATACRCKMKNCLRRSDQRCAL